MLTAGARMRNANMSAGGGEAGGGTPGGFGGDGGGGGFGGGVGGGGSGFSNPRMCVLVPVGFQGGQPVFGGQMMQPLVMQDHMYSQQHGPMLPMPSMPPFQQPQGMVFPPRMLAQPFHPAAPSFHAPAHDHASMAAGMAAPSFNMARHCQPLPLQLPPQSPPPPPRQLSSEVTAAETEDSLFAMFSFKVAPCEKQFVHDW